LDFHYIPVAQKVEIVSSSSLLLTALEETQANKFNQLITADEVWFH
jgi:hypothetical protein